MDAALRAPPASPGLPELALDAVLETVAADVWIVREDGEVVRASPSARARLSTNRIGDGVEAFAQNLPGAKVRWLPPVDGARYALVVRGPDGAGAGSQEESALELARRSWKLTRRQAEVLALLAEGKSNRLIASLLSCSERTVELHVASLFRKADCDSRTALVAKFWRAPRG